MNKMRYEPRCKSAPEGKSRPVAYEMAVLQAEELELLQASSKGSDTPVADAFAASQVQVSQRRCSRPRAHCLNAGVGHPLAAVQP